jgi:Family of unknown function (DUF5670)
MLDPARPFKGRPREEVQMLWGLIVLLVVLWLLGFSFSIGGGLVHLLLVLAVIVLLFNLLSGRRTV